MDAAELETVGLLSELGAEERMSLAEVLRTEEHGRGELLVEEGDLPMKFFLLLDGHVTVHRDGKHVVDLGPGDFFGEVGVLSLEPRNATVISTTPIRVAAAMGWELRRVLDGIPAVRQRLAAVAADRMPSA